MMVKNRAAQGYQLAEMIGLCGEFPADSACRRGGGREYKQVLITQLKKTGVIKVHYKDKLRGYGLTAKAKQILLADNPERFEFYLTGKVDTNIIHLTSHANSDSIGLPTQRPWQCTMRT